MNHFEQVFESFLNDLLNFRLRILCLKFYSLYFCRNLVHLGFYHLFTLIKSCIRVASKFFGVRIGGVERDKSFFLALSLVDSAYSAECFVSGPVIVLIFFLVMLRTEPKLVRLSILYGHSDMSL